MKKRMTAYTFIISYHLISRTLAAGYRGGGTCTDIRFDPARRGEPSTRVKLNLQMGRSYFRRLDNASLPPLHVDAGHVWNFRTPDECDVAMFRLGDALV